MFRETILNRKQKVTIFVMLVFLSLILGFGKIKTCFYFLESMWIFRGNVVSRGLSIELLEQGQSTQNKVCVALKIINKSHHTYTLPDPVAHRYYLEFIHAYDSLNKPVKHTATPRLQMQHKLAELVVLGPQMIYQTPWINIGKVMPAFFFLTPTKCIIGTPAFVFSVPGKYTIRAEYVFFRDFYWQSYGKFDTWPKRLQNKLWAGRVFSKPVEINISSTSLKNIDVNPCASENNDTTGKVGRK